MPTVYPVTAVAVGDVSYYPHMAKRDVELWRRFVRTHPDMFLAVSYDVALGGRKLQVPDATPEAIAGWQYLTALRIDVVGWMGNQAWIIEVRPDATVSALGAAICYTLVAKREEFSGLQLVPAILCDGIQPDVEWCAQQLGVQVLHP